MSYKVITIPGEHTMREGRPQVMFSGDGDSSIKVTIGYHASQVGEPFLYGEIEFPDVYEFRFIREDFGYEGHPQHIGGYKLGLIEIENSDYVEEMAAKGDLGHLAENRFGDHIPESSVRHYRMIFDHCGRFDVIGQTAIVRAITERPTV